MNLRYLAILFAVCAVIFALAYGTQLIIKNPSIIGHALVSTHLIILGRIENACNLTYRTGWNLVSFSCLSADLPYDVFYQNSTNLTMRTYEPDDALDKWKSYNPELPSWVVNDLTEVSRKNGYWVYSSNDSGFYRLGELLSPTFMDLGSGWNLIGYPSLTDQEINQTFGPLIPSFDYVLAYNSSDISDPWKEWTWNSSLVSSDDLNTTNPNFGYWIYMLNTSQLVIS